MAGVCRKYSLNHEIFFKRVIETQQAMGHLWGVAVVSPSLSMAKLPPARLAIETAAKASVSPPDAESAQALGARAPDRAPFLFGAALALHAAAR